MRIGTILVLLINDTANTVYHSEVLTLLLLISCFCFLNVFCSAVATPGMLFVTSTHSSNLLIEQLEEI